MTPAPKNFWELLFAAPVEAGGGQRILMRLLRKGGRPFLLLPMESRAAAATMDLYPAQTSRARVARLALRWLLRAMVAPGAEPVTLAVSPTDAFARWLASMAGEPESTGRLPIFGLLAGNPMSEGQRLLVLVFNARQEPVAVVKVGVTARARQLVERETEILAALPATTRGAVRLRGRFRSERLSALALDFLAGDSPREDRRLPELLESWVTPDGTVQLSALPEWQRLTPAAANDPRLARIAEALGQRVVQATLTHGDLTPWNIKVSPTGEWTVLDWERGELRGVPGWDWFHYAVQPAVLVERLPAAAIAQRLNALLASDAFGHYAVRGGITGCERDLLRAYLFYSAEVIQPSEGRQETRQLLEALLEG